MKLENLFDVYNKMKQAVDKYSNMAFDFSDELKSEIKAIYKEKKHTEVKFFRGNYLTILKSNNADSQETDNGKYAFYPNQTVFIAAYAIKYVSLLNQYATKIIGSYQKEYNKLNDISGNLAKDLNNDLNEARDHKNISSRLKAALDDLLRNNEIDSDDFANLEKFLTNYHSWGGGRLINRHDFTDSAVYKATGLIQSKSSLHEILNRMLENSKFRDLVVSEFDNHINKKLPDYTPLDKDEFLNYKSGHNFLGQSKFPYNQILYGAPGTGKSYMVKQNIFKTEETEFLDDMGIKKLDDSKIKTLKKDIEKRVFRQTLYSDFSYTDFVGQIMPVSKNGDITYSFVPMIFTKALKTAKKYHKERKRVYLVLEEISRADVSAVFGDLFQLLDRNNGISEYPIYNSLIAKSVYGAGHEDEPIVLPENLFIIGTVNTSDQNVFSMDTAFKRRFNWKYISIKSASSDNNPYIDVRFGDNQIKSIDWKSFCNALNSEITDYLGLSEDKQIGQFFIKFPKDSNGNYNREMVASLLKEKLLMYLWEDVNNASMENRHIFKTEYKSFSNLYDDFNYKVIFDISLLKKLNLN